jgi:sugar fermentation stimulation protein A
MKTPLLSLPFSTPLLAGRLLRRYNRFLADIELDSGETVVAHCVNTGRMEGLTVPGLRVWVSHEPSAARKLQYTWQIAEVGEYLIGANTAAPNRIVKAMLEARVLPGFEDWQEFRPEAKYGENSRVDFLVRDAKGLHYLEVKNCHLVYPDNRGYFPDSVSDRASKHLRELIALVKQGHRASVVFTVKRTNVECVRPSDVHDPVFANTAREAAAAGVRFFGLQIRPTPEALIVEKAIPADVECYDCARMQEWMKANRAVAGAWQTVRRKKPADE